MFQTLERAVGLLARVTAIVGGFALLAVVIMTCVSIIGRSFIWAGLGPIPGDFELVEMGIGFAVFSALPWCHFVRGHATVDLFEPFFGLRLNRALDVFADLAMFAASYVIAWRLWFGMIDKMNYSETTFILQFPIWKAYALGMVGAVVFVIVSGFVALRTLRSLFIKEAAA